MPRGKRKGQKHLTTLAYGEPFKYADIASGANERENRDLFARELQRRLIALCAENGLELKIETKRSGSEELSIP